MARQDVLDIISECEILEARVAHYRGRLGAGETTLDLFNLREKFLETDLRDVRE